MATMVLSAAGAAVGGPIGSTIGAFAGRQIDRSLRGGQASRVADLRLQTSQYGDQIPAIFGRMRVAGVVIWAGELIRSNMSSKTTSRQAYRVSFAVALSCRKLSGCHRIWADGRLVRDADDRRSVSFSMRLHRGDPDQLPDPLITAFLGSKRAPAFRDLAYVVFEDFDLSTFGNRIPQITLEISSEDSAIDDGQILSELLEIERTGTAPTPVLGYGISGDTIGQALEPLLSDLKTPTHLHAGRWFVGESNKLHVLKPHDPISVETSVDQQIEIAAKLSLRYFDTASDFATGESSARQSATGRTSTLDIPLAIDGQVGKALAQRLLTRSWRERETMVICLPLSFCGVEAGDRLKIDGSTAGGFRVRQRLVTRDTIALSVVKDGQVSTGLPLPRQPVVTETVPAQDLRLGLVELPFGAAADQPTVAIIVDGAPRIVHAQLSGPGINRDVEVSSSPGAIGSLVQPLIEGPADIFDERNALEVRFGSDPFLVSVDDEALLGGANTAVLNGEIIQFAVVTVLDDGFYRLSRLLRGRFDTQIPICHAVGSDFLLLEQSRRVDIPVPTETLGAPFLITIADREGGVLTQRLAALEGMAMRPWRPRLSTCEMVHGDLHLSWMRRGRKGMAWLDFVDTPPEATSERYVLNIAGQSGASVNLESDTSSLTIPESSLLPIGSRPWRIELRQLGTFAASAAFIHIIS